MVGHRELINAHTSLDFRFAAFQVVSAYTNTGTSLSDQSMVPFQTARLMIITMFVLILAGNTAFVCDILNCASSSDKFTAHFVRAYFVLWTILTFLMLLVYGSSCKP